MMKNFQAKSIGTFILLITGFHHSFAQNGESYPIDPSTPDLQPTYSGISDNTQSASMDPNTTLLDPTKVIQGMNSSVDYSTGIVHTYIPLYTVTSGRLSVPVGLAYSSTGHRIEDHASPVGLGWHLTGVGTITRIVRDRPDDEDPYGYFNSRSMVDKIWSHEDYKKFVKRGTFFEPLNNWVTYDPIDTEPDIFHFDICGYSGYFSFDENRNALLFPKQNILIEYPENGSGNEIIIKDDNGNVYTFGAHQITKHIYPYEPQSIIDDPIPINPTYISKWYVTSIRNVYGDEIRFNYNSAHTYSLKYNFFYGTQNDRDNCDGNCIPDPSNNGLCNGHRLADDPEDLDYKNDIHTYEIKDRSIQSIIGHATMKFNYDYNRKDNPNDRRLTRIDISENSMNYTFGQSDSPGAKHLRLDWINLRAVNGLNRNIASFTYHTNHYLPSPGNREDYGKAGFYQPRYSGSDGYLANSLIRIKNGNNAVAEFEYDFTGTSLRIRKITNSDDTHTYSTSYDYPEGDRYSYFDPGNGYTSTVNGIDKILTQIIPKNMNNNYIHQNYKYAIYQTYINSIYDQTGVGWRASEVKETLPNGSYIIRKYTDFKSHPDIVMDARWVHDHSVGNWNKAVIHNSIASHSSKAHLRGLLLEECYYEAENNTPVKKTTYHYNTGETSATIKGYVPDECVVAWDIIDKRVSVYESVSESVNIVKTEVVGTKYESPSETVYEYNTMWNIPIRTKTVDVEGNILETYVKYSYELWNFNADNIYTKMLGKRMNVPVETVNYKNGKVISAELITYKLHNNIPVVDKVYAIKSGVPISDLRRVSVGLTDAHITYDDRYRVIASNEVYDEKGNVLSYRTLEGQVVSNIYRGTQKHLTATITNATYDPESDLRNNEVYFENFEWDPLAIKVSPFQAKTGTRVKKGIFWVNLRSFKPGNYIMTCWLSKNNGVTWEKVRQNINVNTNSSDFRPQMDSDDWVDQIWILPHDARIVSYTYHNGFGKTSEMDHNGKVTYWQYDGFGRLVGIYDEDRRPLEEYHYNYPH